METLQKPQALEPWGSGGRADVVDEGQEPPHLLALHVLLQPAPRECPRSFDFRPETR